VAIRPGNRAGEAVIAAPSREVSAGLRVSAFVCASISLVALLSHVFGVLSMTYFLTFFGLPSILLLLMLTAVGRWLDAGVFLTCLKVGLVGGIVATIGYDIVRLLLMQTLLFDFDSFKSILIFGMWITRTPTSTPQSFIAGWTYHYWNGISFGIMYMMAFARRHWLVGVVYGMLMEAAMIGVFPMFLHIYSPVGFVTVSMAGHAVYGAIIGRAGQRYARSWAEAGPTV
jgi:hypothetical protein